MSNTDFDLPVIITSAGPQPTPPSTLQSILLANVGAIVPGYTAILPMSLIEDVSSTDVGALTIIDTARVETLNAIGPLFANDFMLAQLGQIYLGSGAAPAPPTNTSVYVVLTVTNTLTSSPAPGYVIPIGFTVGDGTYQYVVQDGGVTNSDGQVTLFCISPSIGTWAVAEGSVTDVVTSVPSDFAISCTNPAAGLTSTTAETSTQYRARVLQAGQAISQGMTTMLKTLVGLVSGVQQRLISVLQQSGGGWEIIVGGGDPYQVAGAIFDALFDISSLVGSTMSISNITQANPGVITTVLNHGYSNGQVVQATGVLGMLPINGVNLTVEVITEKSFSIGLNTTGFPAYTSGGVLTPNLRNFVANIIDYPDTYSVPFVIPPEQTVTMEISWNTTLPNFVLQASVAQAVAPAIADYLNSIVVGQPINLLVAEQVFLSAVAGILQPSQVSVLTFTVSINGIVTAPQAGTELVYGDPESYFSATTGGITVLQA